MRRPTLDFQSANEDFYERLEDVIEGRRSGTVVVFYDGDDGRAYGTSLWSNVTYVGVLRALSFYESVVARALMKECVWWRRASLRLALFVRALWVW